MKKALYFVVLLVVGVVGFGIYFLYQALPLANGYTSKYICSQVFLADQDPESVLKLEVKPEHPLFLLVDYKVDRDQQTVTTGGFGFLNPMTALYRKGFGCTLLVDADRDELLVQAKGATPQPKPNLTMTWPEGEALDLDSISEEVQKDKLQKVLNDAFVEPGPDTMRNTRAVVVAYKGRIIAEKYHPDFSWRDPMLGWSMSKSVTTALVGLLVKDGKLDIMAPAPVAAWSGDSRNRITLDQLLRMSSGLAFEEVYAPLKDATNMLYGHKSMAGFAASKPLAAEPDTVWSYSSGTANIIARIVKDKTGGTLASFNNFARRRLFDRIGMFTAIIEPDASGSFVGSSYMYASARDWARFGLLIQNDGVWQGERILPEGWVKYATTPTPAAPIGEYGAMFWLNAGSKNNPENREFPKLPADMVYLSGHNQQITAIIPSRNLIVVRLGVTHDNSWNDETFISDILRCLPLP
ncbi:MAG: serine hydrolase [Deltaproteobacteria bacterium]|jgi:CubicO group peptidase (beta-lactamase class C family)|nr:serine hydrolase [Deltaproteobacteria bacterium]MBT6504907.1 serine hydrolase [Deltaproteobacteria bacterium]MBT7153353.1 serine hydrolase [Deltaproteobacteria bacterium]